ncbi:MAG: hypothetical protein PUB21_11895 [Bacteroidales bacterium]|nr:hypothetical protein [Bacteroidales bacterium]
MSPEQFVQTEDYNRLNNLISASFLLFTIADTQDATEIMQKNGLFLRDVKYRHKQAATAAKDYIQVINNLVKNHREDYFEDYEKLTEIIENFIKKEKI